ncbi:MAG: ArsA family ATPase [Acidimicrobiales bacterium]
MDLTQFFTASRVVIVAGKGGVGKTTLTAAFATGAARLGFSVLTVATDDTGALARALNLKPVSDDDPRLGDAEPFESGEIVLTELAPDRTLEAYLNDHALKRLGDRMARTGMLDLVATATPGVSELLTLGRFRQLAETGADVVVVDAPAAGHAISLLRAPATMAKIAVNGRLKEQADQALEFLGDEARCRVMLVAIPETTPVNETIETGFALEEEIGVALAPIIVNRMVSPTPPPVPTAVSLVGQNQIVGQDQSPGLVAAAVALDEAIAHLHFRGRWQSIEADRLAEGLPLPQIRVVEQANISGEELIDQIARRLTAGVERLTV